MSSNQEVTAFEDSDWVETVDTSSGNIYYANIVTNESSWEIPEELEGKTGFSQNSLRGNNDTTADRYFFPLPGSLDSYNHKSMTDSDGEEFGNLQLSNTHSNRNGNFNYGLSEMSAGTEDRGISHTKDCSLDSDRFAKLRSLRTKNGSSMQDVSSKGSIATETLVEEAMSSVMYDVNILDYVRLVVIGAENSLKKGFDLQKLMSYQGEKIKKPIQPTTDSKLIHIGVLIFTTILSQMRTKTLTPPFKGLSKLFSIVMENNNEWVRDEVYLQLVKQTTETPTKELSRRAWQLFLLVTGIFRPSLKLKVYVFGYIKKSSTDVSFSESAEIARHALLRLDRISTINNVMRVPSSAEIEVSLALKPFIFHFEMLDNTKHDIEVDCWTSLDDMVELISKREGIRDMTPFGLFSVCNGNERSLSSSSLAFDILSFWETEKAKNPRFKRPYLLFKIKRFFEIKEDDRVAINLSFIQAVLDVVGGKYPCSEDDSFRLAALQAQEKFGDSDGSDVFKKEVQKFIPAKYYEKSAREDIKRRIIVSFIRLDGLSQHASRLNYLDFVKAWKCYGWTLFPVNPKNDNAGLPREVNLAVNCLGIFVLDASTLEILREYLYSEVITWGTSDTTFVLVVGTTTIQKKKFFLSDRGTEIAELVRGYVDRLVKNV